MTARFVGKSLHLRRISVTTIWLFIVKESSVVRNVTILPPLTGPWKTTVICNQKLSCRSHLARHTLAKHSEDKQLRECPQCDFRTKHQDSLRFHIRKDHQGVRHECSDCKQSFTTKTSLEIHRDSRHRGVKFSCEICLQIFSSKLALNCHQVRIHDWKRFDCKDCTRSYSTKTYLQRHVRREHLFDQIFESLEKTLQT